jgi:hypothetical protein
MNFQETAQLLSIIQATYRNQLKAVDEDMNALTINIWNAILEDYPYGEIKIAFLQYAKLNKFAPQPSDLIELVEKMRSPKEFLSSEEAWEITSNAIRKYGFHRQKEAFDSFEPKIKRIVKSIGWWNLCYSERVEQLKKNFCSLWDNISHTERETNALPLERAKSILPRLAEMQKDDKK